METDRQLSPNARHPALLSTQHSALGTQIVPVVERKPRERAKLEIQVRLLAGALTNRDGPSPELARLVKWNLASVVRTSHWFDSSAGLYRGNGRAVIAFSGRLEGPHGAAS